MGKVFLQFQGGSPMRHVIDDRAIDESVASTSEMRSFETEILSQRENVKLVMNVSSKFFRRYFKTFFWEEKGVARLFLSLVILLSFAVNSYAADKPIGKIWFSEPKDGEKVKNPVKFCFNQEGLKVVKSSKLNKPTEGHHHILMDIVVPKGANYRWLRLKMVHQSKGESCRTLKRTLSPGKHTVSGLFGKNDHSPYIPVITTSITIDVVE